MHWATTYLKISFLGQKLWPPAIKRFIFETPFEGPLLPCEMAQAPELGCISTNQDKIWCVNAHLVDVDSYQILSGLVEKPLSYNTFNFYYKIANLLNFIIGKNHFFANFIEFSIFSNNNPLIFLMGH